MIGNGNGVKTNTPRCFLKATLVVTMLFIAFWCVIIFYTSRRDRPLNIKVDKEHYKSPISEPTSTGKVPKLWHQMWKSSSIPDKWKSAHEKCVDMNEDYQLVLWTDEMIYNFIANEYPFFYKLFLQYPYHIQRVDVARYFILYHYGGVYLDMDAECKVPFDVILQNMTSKHSILLPMTDIYGVTNSFMVAKPKSEFFKHVISELPTYAHGPYTLVRHTTIIFSTGPFFLSLCVKSYDLKSDIYVISIDTYDEKYFHHAKGGSWHAMDTEIVDAFHFHYVTVLLVVFSLLALAYILKTKKDYISSKLPSFQTWKTRLPDYQLLSKSHVVKK